MQIRYCISHVSSHPPELIIPSAAASPIPAVTFYFDIRSPYAYLAREEMLALGKKFAVAVEALPYAIAAEAFGTPVIGV